MAVDGHDFGSKLIKAGVIPYLPITRIVIDIQMEGPVKIFYEVNAEKKTLDLCLEELLKNEGLKVIPVA